MSAITIDNNLVHYEVLGRGRPVILIHGWLGSWRYWIPTMQNLSTKYRIYAVDLWGFGDTEKDPTRYSFPNQVRLLTDFMDKLGIAKAAIVGHALGAATAISFTRQFPERAPRVMLVSPPLYDMGGLGEPPALEKRATGEVQAVPALVDSKVAAGSSTSKPAPAPPPTSAAVPTETRPEAAADSKAGVAPVLETLSSPNTFAAPMHDGETIARNPFKDRPDLLAALQNKAVVVPGSMAPSIPTPRPPGTPDPLAQPARAEPVSPLVALLMGLNARTSLEKQLPRDDENLPKLRAEVEKTDEKVFSISALSFASVNLALQLSQLASPVLLLHGQDDQFIKPNEGLIGRIAAGRPDGSLLPFLVPDFHHFPMLESSTKFNRLLTDFLDAPDLTNVQMKETWRRQLR